jgi:uncharacterized membrane protein
MNWPHIHLMLNHVPVLGTLFGLALLAWGLWRRNDSLQRAALFTFVAVAVVAIPVYLTGEPAEDAVENLVGTAESAIEAHEAAALLSFIAMEILGALALGALALSRTRFNPALVVRGALAIALLTGGLMAWTANLGGRIRHGELRAAGAGQSGEHEQDREGEGR